jgi:hypothetical protein
MTISQRKFCKVLALGQWAVLNRVSGREVSEDGGGAYLVVSNVIRRASSMRGEFASPPRGQYDGMYGVQWTVEVDVDVDVQRCKASNRSWRGVPLL